MDELLSRRGLRTPFIRLARNGAVVDSSSFTGGGGVGAEIADQVRDDRVAALFAEGTTVVLQALHRTWPAVIEFATELGAELGHPVQANAYVTPPSSRGFSAHYDVHDVFVLQLAGRKHWTMHAPVHPDPLRDQPWNDHAAAVAARARDDAPAIDTVLEPGDAMYLPRGWLHAATALGEVSAHLTVGIHVVTRFALVEALTALVAADPRLRASLPLGIDVADPAAARAAPRRGPRGARRRPRPRPGRRRGPAGARAGVVRRAARTGRPVAVATFAEGLAAGDTVRLRPGLRFRLHRRRRPCRAGAARPDDHAAGRHRAGAAGGARTRIRPPSGGLPGLDEADQLVLVRRLLREGVVVPAARG